MDTKGHEGTRIRNNVSNAQAWRGAAFVWRQDIGNTNGQDIGYTMAKTWVTLMAKT